MRPHTTGAGERVSAPFTQPGAGGRVGGGTHHASENVVQRLDQPLFVDLPPLHCAGHYGALFRAGLKGLSVAFSRERKVEKKSTKKGKVKFSDQFCQKSPFFLAPLCPPS